MTPLLLGMIGRRSHRSTEPGRAHPANARRRTVCMVEFSDWRFDARIRREAETLCDAGYRVDLYLFNEVGKTGVVTPREGLTVHQRAFPGKSRNSTPRQRRQRALRAASIIAATSVEVLLSRHDVYHAHNLTYSMPALVAARRNGSPLVYDGHELHFAHYEETSAANVLRNRLGGLLETIMVRRASRVIQASSERSRILKERYGRAADVVIRNTSPYVDCSVRHEGVRKDHGIPADSVVAFYSGGVYAGGGRRLDAVLAALGRVEHIHLVVVGFMSSSTKKSLFDSAQKYGVTDRFHIHEAIPPERLIEYASGADIGVIPLAGRSLNTRLSALNKVSQYLMAGLALACSDYPLLRRVARCGEPMELGDVFDVSQADSIAAVLSALSDRERLREIRARALESARLEWSWEQDAQALLDLYAGLGT